MIYLCSPYAHPDPAVREQRFDAACVTTAKLLLGGDLVYSPVVHGHPLVRHGLPTDRRGERLRLLLDGYGLTDREGFLDLVATVWRSWRDAYTLWGGRERRERWSEAYDAGRCDYIDANLAWLEQHRAELEAWL